MSEHDPLCPASDGPEKCRCPFIAHIRADQRKTSYEQAEQRGYDRGQREALATLPALERFQYEQGKRDALAGLEGKAVRSAIALARRQALEGAVQRVEALYGTGYMSDVIAAIKGDSDE
jgi:hypothetical protein